MGCTKSKDRDAVDTEEKELTPSMQLQHAAAIGDNEKVKAAVEQGANVDEPAVADASSDNYNPGGYPLHMAAEAGHTETVKLLFFVGKEGATPDKKDSLGSTALHRAVSFKHIDVVKQLLERGADVHATNKIGNTPLHIAAYTGAVDIAKVLLAAGADKDANLQNKVNMSPVDYAKKVELKQIFADMAAGVPAAEETKEEAKEAVAATETANI